MEIVNCSACDHGKPCYLKTGATEGSVQFGMSFYVCSNYGKNCNFKIRTTMKPTSCEKHQGEMCELQAIKEDDETNNDKLHCFRCKKGLREGLSWCGSRVWEASSKEKENCSNNMQLIPANKIISKIPPSVETSSVVEEPKIDLSDKDLKALTVEKQPTDINTLKIQLEQKKKLVSQVNVNALPDKGKKIQDNIKDLEEELKKMEMSDSVSVGGAKIKTTSTNSVQLSIKTYCKQSYVASANCEKIPVKYEPTIKSVFTDYRDKGKPGMAIKFLDNPPNINPISNNTGQTNHQQYYGGRMTNQKNLEVRSATEKALVSLHNSLQTCPGPQDEEPDPEGLKTQLKTHQRKALKWLLWRESHIPHGGILADDMGLGKTLTMLALVLKDVEKDLETWHGENGLIHAKTTLIICPASLIHQWEEQTIKHCTRRAFPGDILKYHGTNRETNPRILASYQIVITTYNLIQSEMKGSEKNSKDVWGQSATKEDEITRNCKSPLMKIIWNRIILDEGHNIKNPKTSTGIAVCRLRSKNRWVVTGTPIHNELTDLYGLLRFLRYSPFDEYQVFKNWMANRSSTERLNKLVKSILLQRNKNDVDENGAPIVELPKKSIEVHMLNLEGKEKEVYDKILSYSKSALKVLLKQSAENQISKDAGSTNVAKKTVNTAQILSLLIRMQQCCCHLSLLRPLLDGSPDPEMTDELDDILNKMSNLNLKDKAESPVKIETNGYTPIDLSLYKNDKDFKMEASGKKLSTVLREIKNVISLNKGDKCVVVSQWTTLLKIVGVHLAKEGVKFDIIQGSVNLLERKRIMNNFNLNPKGPEVILLSLKAGGVGLDLIGGNHLFLLDSHWNPALESQACDRIYRIGQTKEVKIHKFICQNTIEERIMELQRQKLCLASRVLQGNSDKNNHKITLQDLKTIFGV